MLSTVDTAPKRDIFRGLEAHQAMFGESPSQVAEGILKTEMTKNPEVAAREVYNMWVEATQSFAIATAENRKEDAAALLVQMKMWSGVIARTACTAGENAVSNFDKVEAYRDHIISLIRRGNTEVFHSSSDPRLFTIDTLCSLIKAVDGSERLKTRAYETPTIEMALALLGSCANVDLARDKNGEVEAKIQDVVARFEEVAAVKAGSKRIEGVPTDQFPSISIGHEDNGLPYFNVTAHETVATPQPTIAPVGGDATALHMATKFKPL